MRLIEELNYDLDFREPRIIIKDNLCIIENVKSIIMVGQNSLTVETPKKYVTINCNNLIIKEILNGRLLVEGQIQGVEIIYASGKDKNRRIRDK